MTAAPQSKGFQVDTVRLAVSSWIEAMRAFEGERYQQQLAEVTCLGLAWIVEDRLAGVNAPEWPALCDQLLSQLQGETPAEFAPALRRYQDFGVFAANVIELAGENKIDLAELAAALKQSGKLAHQVAALMKSG